MKSAGIDLVGPGELEGGNRRSTREIVYMCNLFKEYFKKSFSQNSWPLDQLYKRYLKDSVLTENKQTHP